MADVQVAAIAVVLLGLIAGLISLALLPGRDPLMLSETWRQGYVYAAKEGLGALVRSKGDPAWADTLAAQADSSPTARCPDCRT